MGLAPAAALAWASVVEAVLKILSRFRFRSKKRDVQVVDAKAEPKKDEPTPPAP